MGCRIRVEIDPRERDHLKGELCDMVEWVINCTGSLASGLAPKRSGRLAGSISSSLTCGASGANGQVGTGVYYALYVHQGTLDMITGKPLMRLRPGRGFGVLYRHKVRGQRSQPFLVEAFQECSPWPVIVLRPPVRGKGGPRW